MRNCEDCTIRLLGQKHLVHVLYGLSLQAKPGRTFGHDDCDNEDGHGIQPRPARAWETVDNTGPVPTCMIRVKMRCKIKPAMFWYLHVGGRQRRIARRNLLRPEFHLLHRPKYPSVDG